MYLWHLIDKRLHYFVYFFVPRSLDFRSHQMQTYIQGVSNKWLILRVQIIQKWTRCQLYIEETPCIYLKDRHKKYVIIYCFMCNYNKFWDNFLFVCLSHRCICFSNFVCFVQTMANHQFNYLNMLFHQNNLKIDCLFTEILFRLVDLVSNIFN